MELKAGTLLQGEKYKIVKTLGKGGFGITYLAEQTLMDRQVCIKEFYIDDQCDREANTSRVRAVSASAGEKFTAYMQKFIKEAKTIARLDHANIIRIYDVFPENGTAYYVMEYIDGQTLESYVNEKGRLPEEEAIGFVRQAATALDYIHKNRITHLDVKPANLMLKKNGRLVLIDFGVSKHYDEEGHQTTTTPIGISRGYAPLEQYLAGGVGEFSPESDVYSLGATLYRLLTGSVPTEAPMLRSEGIQFPEYVSENTAIAIVRAMQPDRKERPASANAFMDILDGRSTTLIPDAPAASAAPAAPVTPSAAKEPAPAPSVISSEAEKSPTPAATTAAAAAPVAAAAAPAPVTPSAAKEPAPSKPAKPAAKKTAAPSVKPSASPVISSEAEKSPALPAFLSDKKKLGLILGIAGAVIALAVALILLLGRKPTPTPEPLPPTPPVVDTVKTQTGGNVVTPVQTPDETDAARKAAELAAEKAAAEKEAADKAAAEKAAAEKAAAEKAAAEKAAAEKAANTGSPSDKKAAEKAAAERAAAEKAAAEKRAAEKAAAEKAAAEKRAAEKAAAEKAAAEKAAADKAAAEKAAADKAAADAKAAAVRSGSRVIYSENGLFGFKDGDGNVIVPATYANVWKYSPDGYAKVKQSNNKIGLIDRSGKVVIPAKYNDVFPFSEGLARVLFNGRYGFVDTAGNEVIPPAYKDAYNFASGHALVAKGNKWGFVDKNGTEKNFNYDYMSEVPGKVLLLRKGGLFGFTDKAGRELSRFIYTECKGYETKAGGRYMYLMVDQHGEEVAVYESDLLN